MADHHNSEFEDLWSVQRTAKFLDVSPSWVYLHTEKGDLPFCRIGGQKKFIPSAVRAYALAQRSGGGATVLPLNPEAGR